MAAKSKSKSIPFENRKPKKTAKKSNKAQTSAPTSKNPTQAKTKEPAQKAPLATKTKTGPVTSPKSSPKTPATKTQAIPEVVSKRMVRRMAIFCGVPSALGLSSFFVFYLVQSNGWLNLPPTIVLLTSLGLFGLGVIGLSYGLLSASWDEDRVGGWWGVQELGANFDRLTTAWRVARQARKEAKSNS